MKNYKFWLFGLFAECKIKTWTARSYEEAEEMVKDFLSKTNMYHAYKFFKAED